MRRWRRAADAQPPCGRQLSAISHQPSAQTAAPFGIPYSLFPIPYSLFPIPYSLFPKRLLAIDYGDRRIGLAVSDPTGTIASPAGFILRRRNKRPPIAEMIRRGTELEVEGYVVGLPLDENGDDTPRAVETRHVAAELEKRTGLPVRLVDERFTTAAALRAIREMGGSTRGRKGDVDALAATLLLQHALSLPR